MRTPPDEDRENLVTEDRVTTAVKWSGIIAPWVALGIAIGVFTTAPDGSKLIESYQATVKDLTARNTSLQQQMETLRVANLRLERDSAPIEAVKKERDGQIGDLQGKNDDLQGSLDKLQRGVTEYVVDKGEGFLRCEFDDKSPVAMFLAADYTNKNEAAITILKQVGIEEGIENGTCIGILPPRRPPERTADDLKELLPNPPK